MARLFFLISKKFIDIKKRWNTLVHRECTRGQTIKHKNYKNLRNQERIKKDWFCKEIKFWQDCWCGESPLLVHFPKLFRFCRDKETSVVELMKFSNGVLLWDVTC